MYPLGTLMAKKGKCDITAVDLPMPDQPPSTQRSWPGRATLSAILVLLLLSASLTLWWSLHEFMVYETVTVNCVDCAYDENLEATTFKIQEMASHTEQSLKTTAPPATTIPPFSMEFNVTIGDDPEPQSGATDISEIIQNWFQTIQDMLVPPFFRAPEPSTTSAPPAEITTAAPSVPSTTEDHSILLSLMNAFLTPTKNETEKPILVHDSDEAPSSSEELIPRNGPTKQLATSSARDQADLPTAEPEENVRINFMQPEQQPKEEKTMSVYYDDDDDVYDFEEYDDE